MMTSVVPRTPRASRDAAKSMRILRDTYRTEVIDIGELVISSPEDPKKKRSRRASPVSIHGEVMRPTYRFWVSLFAKYAINDNFLRYFTPAEIVGRIAQHTRSPELRVTSVEEEGRRTLLGVCAASRSWAEPAGIENMLAGTEFTDIRYLDGFIVGERTARQDADFAVGGDAFELRDHVRIPVDGYGNPEVATGALRQVCTNGCVAWGKVYGGKLAVGRDLITATGSALENYVAGEKVVHFRDRLEAMTRTTASVAEVNERERFLVKHREDLLPAWRAATGNLAEEYGVTNLDALHEKQSRVLQAKASIYDMFNFLTEASTHHATPRQSVELGAQAATLLTMARFDLEDQSDAPTEHRAHFLN